MTNGEGHTIYMLGIGGIGMSALARYYQSMGYAIAGYDRTKSRLTFQLEKEGMAIHYEDRPELLPESIDMVIYTPAVPHDLKEFEALRQRELPILKRSEALGKISKDHFTIAVSGTHGKTTTTAMIAHILNHSRLNTTAFIGGIAKNFDSNLLLGKPKDSILVVEADEFDRSFLQLHPDVSIIGSIDADHLDIYGDKEHLIESFNDFAKLTKRNVIVREGLEVEAWNKITYGFGDDCKYQIILGNSGSGYTMFYIKGEGQDKFKIIMPLAGIHNVLNATAAFIAARRIGVSRNAIAEALHTFMGVKRRFDVRINTEKYCYIDDYAHHPEEIRSCLQAIRDFYPNRRLTLVFQPHLYSRTRDFMDEFAEVLATADELILLDIYAAREEPLEGVSSQVLLDKIQMPDKKLVAKTQLIKLIDNEKPELLVTMGAGDIDRYVELFEELIKSW
ncbi:MAG: UDP-N-acetylmuramate--L-alanine ligase [Bacteroidales bacterium]|nr:UDP-N-acetylmuramate--L-alanine ligase [Bacteroidales bacterium]